MSSETGLIVLYGQSFEGEAMVEGGEGVSEESRLHAAPFGVYEFTFRQPPRYELSGAVFFNGAEPDLNEDDERKQFEVIEDITGIERTMMIQRAGTGDISIESVEIIPLDLRRSPLDVTRLEVSASRRTIRYAKNPPPEALTIRISGLNVLEVESVTACLWTQRRKGTRFSEPQAAFITHRETIRIDRLNNPRGVERGMEEHLLSLLDNFSEVFNGRAFELDCRYQYQLADGGLEASVPVLPGMLFDSGRQGAVLSALVSRLKQWYGETSPQNGGFAFGVKFYSVRARQPVPVLYLSQLILPFDSIADIG